jgi:hypothetical protein
MVFRACLSRIPYPELLSTQMFCGMPRESMIKTASTVPSMPLRLARGGYYQGILDGSLNPANEGTSVTR